MAPKTDLTSLPRLAALECQETSFARSQQQSVEEISSCALCNRNPISLEPKQKSGMNKTAPPPSLSLTPTFLTTSFSYLWLPKNRTLFSYVFNKPKSFIFPAFLGEMCLQFLLDYSFGIMAKGRAKWNLSSQTFSELGGSVAVSGVLASGNNPQCLNILSQELK